MIYETESWGLGGSDFAACVGEREDERGGGGEVLLSCVAIAHWSLILWRYSKIVPGFIKEITILQSLTDI